MRLGPAHIEWTTADDGDLGRNSAEAARVAHHGRPWLQLTQVHGDRVVVADDLSAALAEADAAVTTRSDLTLAIATADCAPIALSSPEGIIGAVHGGWRGLAAGVLERTAEQMRSLGASRIQGALGPCIHAECYEFDPIELERLAEQWGSDVVSKTEWNTPGLDMIAAVCAAASEADVELTHISPTCTACDTKYFSHRARKDAGRQVMLVWKDA